MTDTSGRAFRDKLRGLSLSRVLSSAVAAEKKALPLQLVFFLVLLPITQSTLGALGPAMGTGFLIGISLLQLRLSSWRIAWGVLPIILWVLSLGLVMPFVASTQDANSALTGGVVLGLTLGSLSGFAQGLFEGTVPKLDIKSIAVLSIMNTSGACVLVLQSEAPFAVGISLLTGTFLTSGISDGLARRLGAHLHPALELYLGVWPYIRRILPLLLGLVIGYCFIVLVFAGWFTSLYRSSIGNFADAPAGMSFFDFIYFSMMTISTLGYDAVRPTSPMAQSLVFFETVAGRLWEVVIVAAVLGYLAPSFAGIARQDHTEQTDQQL